MLSPCIFERAAQKPLFVPAGKGPQSLHPEVLLERYGSFRVRSSDPAFCRVHYFRRRRTAKVNKVCNKYGLQKRRKTKGLERLGKGEGQSVDRGESLIERGHT